MGDVSISIDGKRFLGWKEISIQRSLDALCGSFSLSYTDAWDYVANFVEVKPGSKKWYIQAGDKAEIYIDDDLVMTGNVDEIGSSISKDSRNFTVSGRDQTGDLVDCAASAEKFETWNNLNLYQIAKIICTKFSIELEKESYYFAGAKFRRITSQGETAHEILDRLARQRGALLITTEKGELEIAKPGLLKAKGGLFEGNNILSASIKVDHKKRFSKYFVYGQAHGDGILAGESLRKAKHSAVDLGITRYRPKVSMNDDSTTGIEAQKRVQWEAIYNASRGTQATVTVNGWRQGPLKSDPLWQVNRLVQVKAPSIGIEGELLIESVNFKLGTEGEITELTLTRKDAWIPNPAVPKTKDILEVGPGGKVPAKSLTEQAIERFKS